MKLNMWLIHVLVRIISVWLMMQKKKEKKLKRKLKLFRKTQTYYFNTFFYDTKKKQFRGQFFCLKCWILFLNKKSFNFVSLFLNIYYNLVNLCVYTLRIIFLFKELIMNKISKNSFLLLFWFNILNQVMLIFNKKQCGKVELLQQSTLDITNGLGGKNYLSLYRNSFCRRCV